MSAWTAGVRCGKCAAALARLSDWNGGSAFATDGAHYLTADSAPSEVECVRRKAWGVGSLWFASPLTPGQLAMAYARAAKAARKARKAECLTGRRLVWRRIEARHPQEWWNR